MTTEAKGKVNLNIHTKRLADMLEKALPQTAIM
jgi:hypothetical protein